MIKLFLSYPSQKFLPTLLPFHSIWKTCRPKDSMGGGHEQPGCWFQCKQPCGTLWLGISVQVSSRGTVRVTEMHINSHQIATNSVQLHYWTHVCVSLKLTIHGIYHLQPTACSSALITCWFGKNKTKTNKKPNNKGISLPTNKELIRNRFSIWRTKLQPMSTA